MRSLPRDDEYPRLLLVNSQAFNLESGPGITLTNLFRGWPADRIAMIHSDVIPPSHEVCRTYYELGPDELTWIKPLDTVARLCGAPSGRVAEQGRPSPAPAVGVARVPSRILRRLLAPAARRFVVGDMVRRFRISTKLAAWIEAFQPQVIYAQLATLGYMRLVDELAARTGVPLALHFMDDWPMTLHNHSMVRPFLRPTTTRLLNRLLARASVHAGISEKMARVYEQRYGHPFLSFHNPIDPALHPPPAPEPVPRRAPFRLVFAGTLNPLTTIEAMRDVSAAVESLRHAGEDVTLEIYGGPPVYGRALERPGVTYAGYISDQAEAAEMQRRADVLVLPLNFNQSARQFLALSMPTKTTSYMASGTPILVYAPHDTALAEYATEGQWACVVSRRSTSDLEQAILRLCTDAELRQRSSRTAYARAMDRHTIPTVTAAFHRALIEGAKDEC